MIVPGGSSQSPPLLSSQALKDLKPLWYQGNRTRIFLTGFSWSIGKRVLYNTLRYSVLDVKHDSVKHSITLYKEVSA